MNFEDSIVQRVNDDLISTDLNTEQVLMNPRDGRYYGLNPTAKYIFSEVEEPIRIGVLVDRVVDRYGIGREVASADVAKFLKDMEGRRLVKIHSPSSAS